MDTPTWIEPPMLAKLQSFPAADRWKVVVKILIRVRSECVYWTDQAERLEADYPLEMVRAYRLAVSRSWAMIRQLQDLDVVDDLPKEPNVTTAAEARTALDGLIRFAKERTSAPDDFGGEHRRAVLTNPPASGKNETPKDYLFGWSEIMKRLGRTDTELERKRIVRLNGSFKGPLIVEGPGSPPKVDGKELVEWWNGLESDWEERKQHEADARETAAEQYPHGRDGTVAPEISGHVKKRKRR
jgi:hypothetical protein